MKQHNWIMIVDDNPIDQKITLQALKSCSKEKVILQDNAKDALEYLRLTLAKIGRMPKLIFLDLDMPKMNGIDFLIEFAKFSPKLKRTCKIIVLTSSQIKKDLAFVKAHPDVVKLIAKPLLHNSLSLSIA